MKQTPLHAVHVALGARMVEFGGWHMPLQYGSILEEGKTVRTACGLFDLSHMGRFQVQGRDAVALVDRVCTNHCAKISSPTRAGSFGRSMWKVALPAPAPLPLVTKGTAWLGAAST